MVLLNSYYKVEINYYNRRDSISHDYSWHYSMSCSKTGNPTRAMYPTGGALGYIYFYPLNIRLKLNMI